MEKFLRLDVYFFGIKQNLIVKMNKFNYNLGNILFQGIKVYFYIQKVVKKVQFEIKVYKK